VKPTLALRQSQRLSLTPELRQALGLLQLSAVELATKVQEALEGNVLLEQGDEVEDTPSPAPDESLEAQEALVEGVDWEGAGPVSGWDDEDSTHDDSADKSGQSLREYLLWQLELARLSARDAAIGAALIDSLNDDGYLTEPLEEIRLALTDSDEPPEREEMEAVLHRLQAFDPPGVAARDLKECLLLQLRQMDETDPVQRLAVNLVQGHLEALAGREYAQLCRILAVARAEFDAALDTIQGLHPRPGSTVSGGPVDYVLPDVMVSKKSGAWTVELNSAAVPRVRVNARYAAALRRGESGGDLARQLQEARWLVRSIRMRNDTLLRVARSIVARQAAFLDRGEEAMQPLMMKDLAAELDLHESTVSRVVANKHMTTPRGTLAFRRFFSAELTADDGGAFSATAIRAMIRKLVAQEDPEAPLSDNHITQELTNRGIRVARRTVAKYRESMTIPPAHERRRTDPSR
jgi:RNA polymerase sigma-54 factor